MDAFTAPTSAARASVALELMCRVKPWPQGYGLGRNVSDCFEMNDGDAVVASGLLKLAKSARYRDAVRLHRGSGVAVWTEFVDAYAEGQ